MGKTLDLLKKEAFDRLDITITDEQIEKAASFKDVGIDSLDSIELIVAIEDEFDIELNEKRLEDDIKNIKDLVEYLAEFD
jgi:NADH dehydrogenase (ubiquinone) 1 alpha/beta subcomplex 1